MQNTAFDIIRSRKSEEISKGKEFPILNLFKKPKHISESSLAVWYQALTNRFNTTNAAVNAIDTKASVLLAAAVAILVFGTEQMIESLRLLGIVSAAGVVVSIVLALVLISLKRINTEVHTTDDQPGYYWKTDNSEFLLQLISDLEFAIKSAEKVNQDKARLYNIMSIIFVVSSLALIASNVFKI